MFFNAMIVISMLRAKRILLFMTFGCTFCGREFPDENYLDKHMKNIHEGKFECTVCGHEFPDENCLDEHMKNIHEVKLFIIEEGPNDAVDNISDIEVKVKKANYTMDMDKQVKHINDNLERETFEIKVEQTPKGGATNITMNPALFLLVQQYMENVRPGQKVRVGKVTATIKENMELREGNNLKVHNKIAMEVQVNQFPGAKTKPTIHLFPGDSKIEIQGSLIAQERAANDLFLPLIKKLLKGNKCW